MYSQSYKRYVLATLTIVYTLNYLDQDLMSLLLQPIKEDLHLSDTRLGFLTGIAFALFYATLGLPIARWADRGNRVTISSLAIGLWGITVMMCVLVTNFVQLMFARIAAAVGESGCMPPTYSLVSDYFPAAAERARAMTVYTIASPLAALTSFIVGGWLNQRYGWRVAFFFMGIPGLVAAVIVRITIAEPRTHSSFPRRASHRSVGMATVLRVLWRQQSSRHLGIGFILLYTMGAGLSPWYAAFMIRSHGMGTADLGVWLGLIFGLSGIAGIAVGGYVASRWFAENEAGQMRMTAVMVAAILPFSLMFLLLPQKQHALSALVPLVAVCNFFFGPTFALMQRLVSDEMRATTLAIVMLLANLIGMGIGPQIVGVLSDWMQPKFGDGSLRYAMLMMSLVSLWSSYHFWRVGNTVGEDLSAISSATPRTTGALAPSESMGRDGSSG